LADSVWPALPSSSWSASFSFWIRNGRSNTPAAGRIEVTDAVAMTAASRVPERICCMAEMSPPSWLSK